MAIRRETTTERIDRLGVDAIARRVAELIDPSATCPRYLDTAAVARMLDVSADWVREHAVELGAIRVGDGPRGALRFELDQIRRALDQRRLTTAPTRRPPRRRVRRPGGVRLLPLPGAQGAPR